MAHDRQQAGTARGDALAQTLNTLGALATLAAMLWMLGAISYWEIR